MLNVVLFGPPGAGKGTQAARLKEKYGLNHISTGEVIREEISLGTPLGKSVEDFIHRGELAPDQLVIDIIAEHLEANKDAKGNIFDGFPRTHHQAEEFDRILSEHGLKVDVMLSLEVPDEQLIARLLARAAQSGRQDDAAEEVIRNRLKIYDAQTAVVAKHYAGQGKYVAIEGTGSMDDVFGRLCAEIDKHL